jgi:ADP-ribose pyrophosphatase YjhB (NUDIX family)
MGWGGRRPGSGPKKKTNPQRERVVAETKMSPRPSAPAEPKADPAAVPGVDVRAWATFLPELEELSRKYAIQQPRTAANCPFRFPDFPEAAVPKDKSLTMAMDSGLSNALTYNANAWLQGPALDAMPGEGLLFLGYTFLAELAQRPEYRVMSETIADDATREWIDFDVVGDETEQEDERRRQEADPAGEAERQADPDERMKRLAAKGKLDKVKALKDDQLRLNVRDHFYEMCRNDGFFGRSHLYLDIWTGGVEPSPDELKSSIGSGRDPASVTKVTKDSFRALRTVEPVWTYPLMYNAIDPLRADWYNPQSWYVMGKEIHCSRLQTFVGHPVPDMLKPAYAFGGLSLSQMAKPYVDIWLQTRQSVADLIKSFSVMVLSTDFGTTTQPGAGGSLLARVAMFNMLRNNQGTFVINKNTEDFKNVTASLSGLHELQSQAQEHMASVHRIPLVKFTGIQPAGLNASSEGEIKTYDDTIAAYQMRFEDPNLRKIVNFQQLSLWGEIDPEITLRWQPLREMTQAEKGQKEKDDSERHQKYVDMGAISPAEVRKTIIEDPDLPYTALDPEDVPDLASEEEDGLEPEGGRPDPKAGGEEGGEPQGGGANDADLPFGATDAAEFKEDEHPRGPDGKFGSGGGGAGKGTSMPDIPDFLKKNKGGPGGAEKGQTLKMPQFGLTPTPYANHQPGTGFKLPPRKPMPKSSGEPGDAGSLVAFGKDAHGIKEINGVKFSAWDPPKDWADVSGQAEISEPPMPELPKGMMMSTGCVVREKDGRVWLMRPAGGFGGYDQTFPKGGLEEGLSGQANAIKEVYEETGLKVKITGFAGDHEGDTTISRFYFAEREGGDPVHAGGEAEGVILAPPSALPGLLNRKRDKQIAESLSPAAQKADALDPADLKQIGKKMGTNEGGTFEDKAGNKFYIKRPQTKAHVQNELAAARLYQLAGVNTLNYREVKGGNHVATDLEKLDKKNVADLTPAERKEATKDFAIHAWLGNYDAAGTGGDNQGVLNGKVTTLDVGGSLRYRAQGAPKGSGWGPKVKEVESMRGKDPSIHAPDAAKLFGKMSESDLKESAARVTSIPDAAIRQAVGEDTELAETLISRKADLAKRFGLQASDSVLADDEADFEEGKHPRGPDGKFATGAGGGSGVPDEGVLASIATLLKKPAIAGSNYRKALIKAIAVAPADEAEVLKAKLAESWSKTYVNGISKGSLSFKEASNLKKKIEQLGGTVPKINIPSKPDTPEAIEAAIEKLPLEKQEALSGGWNPELESYEEFKSKQDKHAAVMAKAKEQGLTVAQSLPAPTEADLQKAKKNVALQLQYVPGAKPELHGGEPMKLATNLIQEFNAKWEGKTPAPEQLAEKVNEFKSMTAKINDLAAQEGAEKAKIQAEANAHAVKVAKAAAEEAVKEKAEAAEKNKDVIAALGVTEEQATAFNQLLELIGGEGDITKVDLLKKFKNFEKQAKEFNYPISGFEYALIRSYINGTYKAVNKALRTKSLSPKHTLYVSMMNKAMAKMPKYTGTVERGTTLSAEQIANYVPGQLVTEHGFTSSGVNFKFSGNVTYKIKANGMRGADFSKTANPNEREVLFLAHTSFMVHKVTKTGNGAHIEMEEM